MAESVKRTKRFSVLDAIEWIGNKLPDPATLFLLGAIAVMVISQIGVWLNWEVQPRQPRAVMQEVLDQDGQPVVDPETGSILKEPVLDSRGRPVLELVEVGEPVRAWGLLSSEGIYWAITNLVSNFMAFPPLGVVLVGMLGIGVAERTGLIAAALKAFMLAVPGLLLTPTMVFIGIMSSLATDAGYVVLPPLAAALYKAVGRSPLAGLAAVFAGVSAGFNANLFITGLDPMLAELSQLGARVIDSTYTVAPTCNWWFMIASTVVITMTGWCVTSWFVERRLNRKPIEEGGPAPVSQEELAGQRITAEEVRGLFVAAGAFLATLAAIILLIAVPGAPLHGEGAVFDRWVEAIVPIIFVSFLVPGIAYGVSVGTVRNEKDATKTMIDSMAAMAPIIVLAFFAAQFIEYFRVSNLGTMMAMAGGQALASADMSPAVLMVVFILVTLGFNLFVGSMSAKYTLFAPVFIPMFMMVGISPELTQSAYRIGDSVSNVITPLNAYLIIILVFMRKYVPNAGIGTLIALMMPYTIVFTIVWSIMLVVWMGAGFPLGIEGPLWYTGAVD